MDGWFFCGWLSSKKEEGVTPWGVTREGKEGDDFVRGLVGKNGGEQRRNERN